LTYEFLTYVSTEIEDLMLLLGYSDHPDLEQDLDIRSRQGGEWGLVALIWRTRND